MAVTEEDAVLNNTLNRSTRFRNTEQKAREAAAGLTIVHPSRQPRIEVYCAKLTRNHR